MAAAHLQVVEQVVERLAAAFVILSLLSVAVAATAGDTSGTPFGTNSAGVPGACPLSPAGQNNNNGNGKGTATDVIDVYNDKEYPFCQNCTCPDLKGMCFNDSCSDKAGKFGRWRLPVVSSLVCPPGQANMKENREWCFDNQAKTVTPKDCCKKCSEVGPTYCQYWQHYVGVTNPGAQCLNCGVCWFYPPGTSPKCETNVDNNNGYRIKYNCSQVGRNCATGKNDPHFYGADGTRFEFNGLPDRSFCLLTDKSYHVNMKMHGYYDSRTVGASILHNGKAVRTWIRELGVVYRESADSKEHKLHLIARAGKQQVRGEGYLQAAVLDGQDLPRLAEGESHVLPGGVTFTFVGTDAKSHFLSDHYHLILPGGAELDIKLRAAHPLLQTPDDAEVHFNVAFEEVKRTETVHGVMGQTYRKGRMRRALSYQALGEVLHHPVSADGESGAGYLDGEVADYRTSDVLSYDCKWSAFGSGELPQLPARPIAASLE